MIALNLILSGETYETVLVNPAHIVFVGCNDNGTTRVYLAHGQGRLDVSETQADIFDRIMEIRR
jgi:hypothetical protein